MPSCCSPISTHRSPSAEAGVGRSRADARGVVLRLCAEGSTTRLGRVLITKPTETTSTTETVKLRPLERGDRTSLLEIFAGLGARSRQQRFLTPKTRLSETE